MSSRDLYRAILFLVCHIISLPFCVGAEPMDDDTVFTRTPAEINSFLYDSLNALAEVCADHDIDYWLTAGTLLGHVRHGGIIPWDDDIDVQLAPGEETKLDSEEVKAALAEKGLELLPIYLGYRICPKKKPAFGNVQSNHRTKGVLYTWPFIDIFLSERVTINGEAFVLLKDAYARKTWPDLSFKETELFPLNRVSFGPKSQSVSVLVPRQPNPFLERRYGPDWNEVAYRLYDHQNGRWHDIDQKVRIVTREPGPVLANVTTNASRD